MTMMRDVLPKAPEMTEESLLDLLTAHGVPHGQWGGPGLKSVRDLLDEITNGETTLVEDEFGLTRVTNSVGVDVFALVYGVRYWLVEARQVFPDGTVKNRQLSTSLGEKIKNGETAEDAIRRALTEELGVALTYGTICSIGATETRPRVSESYPGLRTVVTLTHAAVELPLEQYNPAGYVEVQPGRKDVYFEWEPIYD